jgi:septum formation protein
MPPILILASASPRRALILQSLHVPFRVVVTDVDERLAPSEPGHLAAERLARDKAMAVQDSLPILAADTLVLLDDHILGKPASGDEARWMLRQLAGRRHEVVTGVCLRRGDRIASGVTRTLVELVSMSDDEIAWYVATGEPMDKAGAYHIDGRAALFVRGIEGSPSNVAGLPVTLVRELATRLGVDLWASRVIPPLPGGG